MQERERERNPLVAVCLVCALDDALPSCFFIFLISLSRPFLTNSTPNRHTCCLYVGTYICTYSICTIQYCRLHRRDAIWVWPSLRAVPPVIVVIPTHDATMIQIRTCRHVPHVILFLFLFLSSAKERIFVHDTYTLYAFLLKNKSSNMIIIMR